MTIYNDDFYFRNNINKQKPENVFLIKQLELNLILKNKLSNSNENHLLQKQRGKKLFRLFTNMKKTTVLKCSI